MSACPMKVRKALEDLGDTWAKVVGTLARGRFKGIRKNGQQCTVACYLKATVPDCQDITVYEDEVAVGKHTVEVPEVVQYVISYFDGYSLPGLVLKDNMGKEMTALPS